MHRITTLRRPLARLAFNVARRGRRSVALGAVLLAASAATVLATANTPPTITSATLSRTDLKEGETVTLSVSFMDPDATDFHNVRLKWSDRSGTQQVNIPVGETSVQVSHTFVDGNVGSPYGQTVRISLNDRQTPPGSEPSDNTNGPTSNDFVEVPVHVVNVAPSFVDRGITVTKKGAGQVVVEGDVVDPGSADQIQVAATWGDPTSPGATACSIGRDGRHFVCEHAYRPNLQTKTYPINLTVKDDDGGLDQHQTTVRLP